MLIQFSTTVAALAIGEAYLDEKDVNQRAKKRGFLYTKVILLYIGMVLSLVTAFSSD